jgi:hypothetical protein
MAAPAICEQKDGPGGVVSEEETKAIDPCDEKIFNP